MASSASTESADELTPIRSTGLQRFLGGAVACLLTANGIAVVALASDDVNGPPPAEQGSRTGTLVETPDGTASEVDPSTPDGRSAIEQAERTGATTTETTVPAEQAASTPEGTPPTLASETAPASGPLPTPPTLPVDPQKTIDDTQELLDDALDDIQRAVPTPLDDTVDTVRDTVGDTVDRAQDTAGDTVQDTVDEVQETVTTVRPTTTTTTPATSTTIKAPAPAPAIEDAVKTPPAA